MNPDSPRSYPMGWQGFRRRRRARPPRPRGSDKCWRKFARERDDLIAASYWYRHWSLSRKVKAGTRVRVPAGKLHVSRGGDDGKQYLCGRPVKGKLVASACGIVLPTKFLCLECLRRLCQEAGI